MQQILKSGFGPFPNTNLPIFSGIAPVYGQIWAHQPEAPDRLVPAGKGGPCLRQKCLKRSKHFLISCLENIGQIWQIWDRGGAAP